LEIVLLFVCSGFGQQLKIKRNGNIARVMQGGKVLYQVALKGKANEKGRKYDEAFLAGACLIVRRDIREVITGTESYPDVSRLEIYQTNGKRRIYRESSLEIRRVSDWDLINSPDFTWAIIPDNGEAMFDGYFYVSPRCEIRQIAFNSNDNFDWGDKSDAKFIDAATLKFSPIVNRLPNEQTKKVNIFITKDGKFRIEDIEK
jgi:hypothetical protein